MSTWASPRVIVKLSCPSQTEHLQNVQQTPEGINKKIIMSEEQYVEWQVHVEKKIMCKLELKP